MIIVSLNGRNKELINAAKNCFEKNIPLIVLTANSETELKKWATVIFSGYKSSATEAIFKEYEVRSRLPLQVLVRILLDAYSLRTDNFN